MELLEYLRKNKGVINLTQLEERLKVNGKQCPATTLHRYTRTGKIAKKWKAAALAYIGANLAN